MELYEAMKHRRSRYALDAASPIDDDRIAQIVADCLAYTPSAFHSETARVIMLLGENHAKLWSIVMETLRAKIPEERFASTEQKINGFSSAYATLLFYEEQDTVASLQERFPSYADNFPLWSLQASGMVQYSVWTALSSEGLGANLQHYNPLIDSEVARAFDVPPSWKLWSQMVIGRAIAEPDDLEYMPADQRLIVKR